MGRERERERERGGEREGERKRERREKRGTIQHAENGIFTRGGIPRKSRRNVEKNYILVPKSCRLCLLCVYVYLCVCVCVFVCVFVFVFVYLCL